MKKSLLIMGILSGNILYANSVDRIIVQNNDYVLFACDNGAKGIVTRNNERFQCVTVAEGTKGDLKAKCGKWGAAEAANYFCANINLEKKKTSFYVEQYGILCKNKKSLTSEDAQDKVIVDMKKAFKNAEPFEGCIMVDGNTRVKILETYKNYKLPLAKVIDRLGTTEGYTYLEDIKKE